MKERIWDYVKSIVLNLNISLNDVLDSDFEGMLKITSSERKKPKKQISLVEFIEKGE